MASSTGGGGARRWTDTSDFARFTEPDASRSVYLVKIPPAVMEAWREKLEQGGLEITTSSGDRDLVPEVDLGTFVEGPQGPELHIPLDAEEREVRRYKFRLLPAMGLQQRIISSENTERGENVKFEGVVAKTGQLMPMAIDEAYQAAVRQRVKAAEPKVQVTTINEREEQAALRQIARPVIAGIGEDKAAASAALGKKRKLQEPVPAGGADGGESKKKKTTKKKDREVSKDDVREALMKCFEMIDPTTGQPKRYWKQKDLRKTTGFQFHRMRPVLDEICEYHQGGPHNKTYSLKLV